jgi:hypothetical protein
MLLTQPEQALLDYLRLDGNDNAEIIAQEPGTENVSWGQLCDAALRHGVGPLLYAELKERDLDDILDPPLRSLEGQYFASLARNTLIYHELGAILELLQNEGLQVILLKGAALAGTVYPRIALRPMSDVDLLIRVPDLPRVQEMLIARGYVFSADRAREFDRRFGGGKTSIRQIPYPMSIDLHWHLLEWPPGQQAVLLTEWLWSSALERTVCDIPALVLSPEAQVLHLTSHLSKHRWQRLLWFYDVAQVLQCYEEELDWDLILAKATKFEILKALRVTLAKAVELLAPPLPPGILERLESESVGLREKAAFALLTARDKHAVILLSVISKDSLLDKAKFLGTVAFPSAEYMAERYQLSDRRKLPLYYAYRLGSWFYFLLRSLFSVLSQALERQDR